MIALKDKIYSRHHCREQFKPVEFDQFKRIEFEAVKIKLQKQAILQY